MSDRDDWSDRVLVLTGQIKHSYQFECWYRLDISETHNKLILEDVPYVQFTTILMINLLP